FGSYLRDSAKACALSRQPDSAGSSWVKTGTEPLYIVIAMASAPLFWILGTNPGHEFSPVPRRGEGRAKFFGQECVGAGFKTRRRTIDWVFAFFARRSCSD